MATTHQWPSLTLTEWKDTYETLHMWTQIIGKIPAYTLPTSESLVEPDSICHTSWANYNHFALQGSKPSDCPRLY